MLIRRIQGETEKYKGIFYEYDMDAAPIGEGGMGVVYRGFRVDTKTGLRREVAIKILHDDLPEEVYARAEREASIQLRHDNLVEMLGLISIFETNRWGEPVYHHYIISEFLHGMELSDVLRGRFTGGSAKDDSFARSLFNDYLKDREATSVRIIRNILSGVMALHDRGFIHRDIDPSNIMVTDDGQIKLIDFGIAKNLHALESKDKLMTASGQFIGKAEYASPELVLGDVKHQDYTTDIYALGILFYRLLVGALPFNGTQYEVLQQQLKHKVPVRNVENKELAKVVGKATDKLQGNRFASIAEFRVAIDNAVKMGSVQKKTGAKYYMAAVVIVAILICGGLWKYGFEDHESADETEVIVTDEMLFADALKLLESADAESSAAGFGQMLELADKGYAPAMVEVGMAYYNGAYAYDQYGNILRLSSDYNKVFEYLEPVLETHASPEVYYVLGMSLAKLDKHEEQKEQILSYFDAALGQIDGGVAVKHGYSAEELKIRLENNIQTLKPIDIIN